MKAAKKIQIVKIISIINVLKDRKYYLHTVEIMRYNRKFTFVFIYSYSTIK